MRKMHFQQNFCAFNANFAILIIDHTYVICFGCGKDVGLSTHGFCDDVFYFKNTTTMCHFSSFVQVGQSKGLPTFVL